MDAAEWIAAGSAGVAVLAAGFSWRQVRHANGQVLAAQEQVVVARRKLEHAQKVHREQNEPYVIVDIQPAGGPRRGLLLLIVENIGSTVARNVRITADPPLESALGAEYTTRLQRALERTFPMIPPGRRLEYTFDGPMRWENTELPTAYTFTVRCEGPFGRMEEQQYAVDFGTWVETLLPPLPLKQMEDNLEKIRRELKSMVGVFEKSHAPAIREENEHAMQQHRERAAARTARQNQAAEAEAAGEGPSEKAAGS
ncbi:hypothetical protein [Streptomyces exfoliatus]|uniref:hypothetical protein n=1 Tax=Streptomyces exfoliatus TaxID=1905 RepID=UPI0006894291|nr:hypothetical protein [Streptomyces exfoliatus]